MSSTASSAGTAPISAWAKLMIRLARYTRISPRATMPYSRPTMAPKTITPAGGGLLWRTPSRAPIRATKRTTALRTGPVRGPAQTRRARSAAGLRPRRRSRSGSAGTIREHLEIPRPLAQPLAPHRVLHRDVGAGLVVDLGGGRPAPEDLSHVLDPGVGG